jgi:hypothetical protein
MRFTRLGTLIRHAASKLPATIGTLTVAMIQPSLGALLMPPVGCAMLTPPRLDTALCATVPLPTIAAHADPEHRSAIRVVAKPQPENNFPVNRHPRWQAGFDNGSGSCQGKTTLRLPSFLA